MSGNRKRKAENQSRGLQTELHPALKSTNLTLIKEQQHKSNPYLSNESDIGNNRKRAHLSRFFHKGEIIERVTQERAKLREVEKQLELSLVEEQEEKKLYQLKVANGELPDLEKDENKFIKNLDEIPEDIEWWDAVYLDKKTHQILEKYIVSDYNSDEEEENENDDTGDESYAPSIRYVHHPLIQVNSKATDDHLARIYLTKKEHRRIRRHKRKAELEEKETKIKLGLTPKPEPKVKLSNMMNVLENDANIVDPTSYEKIVREQVQERKEQHIANNNLRHEEAVKRRKEEAKVLPKLDFEDIYYCNVYKFQNLKNPQLRYKLNMNAKQLKLRGCCLRVGEQGPGIIISVANEKNSKFFNKLIMNRLKWNESFENRSTGEIVKNDENCVKHTWNGTIKLKEHPFSGWFMRSCQDNNELKGVLTRFNGESFYRDTLATSTL
ncbi:similar to Saccharomyces cerevisiae YDR473C PRP3 Splicing factor, component of the U4/U6-U5 snRNP complex [Maudiozyma saulgeensis]|uniref:Similar to Saccharomyces cerevisiae YDR473C PRP3 Splicing factor, component of the U4/U6-U5 snRNP complex n=1 Tax=Maudiozyma saulgeensis TaxID=1789683 RepID=A0A1X7R9W8_9SACH|nr:similar to Saccharomyces cerevisiae YDR473C PRP3 Splicing factor, component of the U4/U6-U5 snRNP complex [Kazachstania saulgeensis]